MKRLLLTILICLPVLSSCTSNNMSFDSSDKHKNSSERNISANTSSIAVSSESDDSSVEKDASQNAWIDYANPNNTGYNAAAIDVSIIQLIANPTKYNNKIVRVIGVGNVDFEGDAIYYSKDDWKYGLFSNGFWLEFDNLLENADKINGKYVILEGTFNMNNKGHLGAWPGAIEKITRYQLRER